MSFKAVPDACALYPPSLRDTLLRAAKAKLYRVQLTEDILEEVRRNFVKELIRKGEPEYKAQQLIMTIREKFDHAFVSPSKYKPRIASMPNNTKDRHVLAAAVASNAEAIVTQNLKDFPPDLLAPYEVEAQSPDEFLSNLFDYDRESMVDVLIKQAGNLRNPSMTVLEVLDRLKLHAPQFSELAREEFNSKHRYLWLNLIKAESNVK